LGDPRDPDSRRLTALLAKTTADFIKMISLTVKKCKPEAAALFHAYPKADTVSFYDGALTEIHAGRPWVHGAWKYGEMASYANVFPVPAFFNIYPERRMTRAESRYQAFQGLANGVYPNFWSTIEMKPVFGFLRRSAQYYDFGRTTPVQYAALVRVHWLDSAQRAAPRAPGVRYASDRFLAPCVGAYSAMARSGLPMLTRHHHSFHKQLQGLRAIVLPNAALLSQQQLDAVRQYVRAGGGLVCTHETSLYDETGERRSDFGLADVLGVHYRGVLPAADRRLTVVSPQHPVAARLADSALRHDQPHVVVQADSAQVLATLKSDKAEAPEAPAILAHQFGKGRVVYLPGQPDAIQCEVLTPWIERLFAAATGWVAQEDPPVELSVQSMVGVTLFEQPQRRILHLVNYPCDTRYESDEFRPVRNLKVAVAVPPGRRVQRVHRLWRPAELPFAQTEGRASFAIDELGEYEVLALEHQ
jgi:type 1 glutamine amidotransferase